MLTSGRSLGRWMAQGSPWFDAGVPPVVKNDLPIDDHISNAFAVLEWSFISGAIHHPVRVEDGNICKRSFPQPATVAQADFRRVQRSHFTHGIFQPEQSPIAGINTKHAWKGAKVARMRMTPAQGAINGER